MNTPTDGERDLAALCVRLVRRLREVSPGDKLATSATDYLNRKRYLNPLRIKALEKADALGVPVADRLHPECAWCTFCGKTDHTESQCPTVADGVAVSPKPFPAPGKWFPVDVTGTRPMREVSPGKWELAEWPSAGVPVTKTTDGERHD